MPARLPTPARCRLGYLANSNTNVPPAYSGVSFFSGGTNTEEVFFGVPSDKAKYGFDVTGAAGGMKVGEIAFQNNPFPPSFLVYRLNFTPNGETLDFFYRPAEGVTPTTPTATFAIPGGTFADTLTALRIQSGNGNGNFNGTEFDEIRIGATMPTSDRHFPSRWRWDCCAWSRHWRSAVDAPPRHRPC